MTSLLQDNQTNTKTLGCFLEAFRYLKPTKKHPFEATGIRLRLLPQRIGSSAEVSWEVNPRVCFGFWKNEKKEEKKSGFVWF